MFILLVTIWLSIAWRDGWTCKSVLPDEAFLPKKLSFCHNERHITCTHNGASICMWFLLVLYSFSLSHELSATEHGLYSCHGKSPTSFFGFNSFVYCLCTKNCHFAHSLERNRRQLLICSLSNWHASEAKCIVNGCATCYNAIIIL